MVQRRYLSQLLLLLAGGGSEEALLFPRMYILVSGMRAHRARVIFISGAASLRQALFVASSRQ